MKNRSSWKCKGGMGLSSRVFQPDPDQQKSYNLDFRALVNMGFTGKKIKLFLEKILYLNKNRN